MRYLAAAAIALIIGSAAHAEDDAACAKFKWSIEKERSLMASPKPLASDGALDIESSAYRVTLADDDKINFPATPERALKAGGHGAVLTFSVKADGVYDIALSDEGWIDVVDHGKRVSSNDFSGQRGCPGVRKSVRFPLKAGDLSIQLSNIEGPAINIAVVPAP